MFSPENIDFRRKDSATSATNYLNLLGWNNFRIKDSNSILDRTSAFAYIRDRASLLLTTSTSSKKQKSIQDAAFYAYHSGITWGLVLTKSEVSIFNSQWSKGSEWYSIDIPFEEFSTIRSIGSWLELCPTGNASRP